MHSIVMTFRGAVIKVEVANFGAAMDTLIDQDVGHFLTGNNQYRNSSQDTLGVGKTVIKENVFLSLFGQLYICCSYNSFAVVIFNITH